MVIVYYASVGTNRNVYARFFVILVARLRHFYESGRLSSADAFLFARNADTSAADTDFYEIRARFRKEKKSVSVNDVTRADFYGIAVLFADKVYSAFPYTTLFRSYKERPLPPL